MLRWIQDIDIESNYKKNLKINLKEEEPFAIYDNDNKKMLFSNNLIFLEILENESKYSTLITFKGKNSITNSKNLISFLENEFKKNIKIAEYVKNRRWNLTLNNLILLKLPENNIKEAINNYKKIYSNLSNKDLKDISTIDLRIKNQAIIKYRKLND